MNIPRHAVAAALCAAATVAGAQIPPPPEASRPIDWRPQWVPAPSLQPGFVDPYLGWNGPRRTGPEPSHAHERSPILRDIQPPSPLAERYVPTFGTWPMHATPIGDVDAPSPLANRYPATIVPVYEVLVVPVMNQCPPPYSASGCMPMR